MKVRIYKSVDIDTEVDVDIDDITSAIGDYLQDCIRTSDQPQRNRSRAVISLCNAIFQSMSAMIDEMIEQVEPKNRQAIYDALSKQIERFKDAP